MEANFSVMTTIPTCQDLELLKAAFPEFLIDTGTPAWVGLQKPLFKEDQFIRCLKIPNPSLIEHQKVRAKIRFGFKVKGSSQLAVICTCLQMETQHLSLQTRFVQNTLVSPPMMFLIILNGKLAATKYAEYMKNIGLAFIFIIYTYIFMFRA